MRFGKEGESPNQITLVNERMGESLYEKVDVYTRPALLEFGEREWGKWGCLIRFKTPDSSSTVSDHGWIVKQIGTNRHYHIEICPFIKSDNNLKEVGFFIKTGGESVLSRGLSKEDLEEVLGGAMMSGPSHLEPPF